MAMGLVWLNRIMGSEVSAYFSSRDDTNFLNIYIGKNWNTTILYILWQNEETNSNWSILLLNLPECFGI